MSRGQKKQDRRWIAKQPRCQLRLWELKFGRWLQESFIVLPERWTRADIASKEVEGFTFSPLSD